MDFAVKFVSRNLVTQKVSSNSETNGIFYDFLGDKPSMTSGMRFLRKSRKSAVTLLSRGSR